MFLLNIFTLLKYFLVLKIYEDRTIKKKKNRENYITITKKLKIREREKFLPLLSR